MEIAKKERGVEEWAREAFWNAALALLLGGAVVARKREERRDGRAGTTRTDARFGRKGPRSLSAFSSRVCLVDGSESGAGSSRNVARSSLPGYEIRWLHRRCHVNIWTAASRNCNTQNYDSITTSSLHNLTASRDRIETWGFPLLRCY